MLSWFMDIVHIETLWVGKRLGLLFFLLCIETHIWFWISNICG